jgi:hypothetical protein
MGCGMSSLSGLLKGQTHQSTLLSRIFGIVKLIDAIIHYQLSIAIPSLKIPIKHQTQTRQR